MILGLFIGFIILIILLACGAEFIMILYNKFTNVVAEKKRQKQEMEKRKERNALEMQRIVEEREALKKEIWTDDTQYRYIRKTDFNNDKPYYDWGLDEPVGATSRDWEWYENREDMRKREMIENMWNEKWRNL